MNRDVLWYISNQRYVDMCVYIYMIYTYTYIHIYIYTYICMVFLKNILGMITKHQDSIAIIFFVCENREGVVHNMALIVKTSHGEE